MENQIAFNDYLNIKENKEILQQLKINKGEKIIFSCLVNKFNRFFFRQERIFLLTNLNIYNIKESQIQRKIDITSVKAITKTIIPETYQFVIHVRNEYDYRYESENRNEIFNAIKYIYWKQNQVNLPVYGVPESSLYNYLTSKSDIAEGNEIGPGEQYRLIKEDIYQEDGFVMSVLPSTQISESIEDFDFKKENSEFSKERSNTVFTKNKKQKVQLSDFIILKMLGKGGFGKVFLVQKKDDKTLYAMKAMKKDVILKYDILESSLLEKNILQNFDHPFLVGMEFVFQTDSKIFYVMQFVQGGELFQHLRQEKRFSEKRTKFYILTIALAISHLHENKIIYRDLKPENILMCEDGYLKLTDFGMAKIIDKNEQAQSFCGTPEYLAPEIINQSGHGFPVDWWALGILTYELMVGFSPFYVGSTNDNYKMFDLIKSKPVYFPDHIKHGISMSSKCKDFITKCLKKNPKERLGSKNGPQDILAHPWFSDLNVDDILSKQQEPEFKPVIKKQQLYDLDNFDNKFTQQEAFISEVPRTVKRKITQNQEKFKLFDQ